MTVDPNWLLSTTAQSSAAIVGIIGALLVTRMVGLAAERSALLRQERSLNERLDQLHDELDPLEEELRNEAITDFIRHARERAVGEPDVDVDTLLDEYADEGLEHDLRPMAERVLGEIKTAYTRCLQCETRPIDPDRITDLVDVPKNLEGLYRDVAREVRRSQMGPMRTLDYASMVPKLTIPPVTSPVYAVAEGQRLQKLRDDVRDVELQHASVKTALNRIGDVRALLPTLWILGVFAVVGVVQPIALLALRPVPSGRWIRGYITISFAAALLLLLWFLLREVRALTRTDSGE